MSTIVENPSANDRAREREDPDVVKRIRRIAKGGTALAHEMTDEQMAWLTQFVVDRWQTMHSALAAWRKKMMHIEKMVDGNYEDRRGAADETKQESPRTIHEKSNHSLGTIAGFADFAFAQARDDLFGTTPFFAATPEGAADNDLAERITKHSHWKARHTNLRETLIAATDLACQYGTAFPKLVWRREVETYKTIETVAHGKDGKPLVKPDGDFYTNLTPTEELPQGIHSWKEMLVTNTDIVFDNCVATNLHYADVAFDQTASELNLLQTDFAHRFSIGLADAASIYNLTETQYQEALSLLGSAKAGSRTPVSHREEENPSSTIKDNDLDANPEITLCEGFFRCAPLGRERGPIRIWCVFSPELNIIFSVDYLKNRNPGGVIPVFPIRWFKKPGRIIGQGYHERFEAVNDFIDEEFNSTNYRDRMAANPVTGVDTSLLDEDLEESDLVWGPGKTLKLKPGAKLADAFQFAVMPDANGRAIELMNMMLQMVQLRTGITSAAQGEIDAVPEASTATGVNAVMSRGATLLKWPIDEVKTDVTPAIGYFLDLLYANQDTEETITWGEGKDAELVNIKPGDVKGLRMNVSLTMTQSQSQTKIATAQAAIQAHGSYIMLPEPEKQSARPLFLQLLTGLGFNNADQIIREPITDPAGIAALLPPEMQAPFVAFAQQMGLLPPATPETPSAAAAPTTAPVPAQAAA